MGPILEINDLHKTYPETKSEALRGVSFNVQPGELFGILGVNGAGKSTLLNILIGIVNPSSGRMKAFGKNVFTHPELRERMNIATAYADLAGSLTVENNLMVYAKLYEVKNPRPKIAELLAELGISQLAKYRFDQLSAGQRTRVNLCKSLINDPELILLDEPTASLDPSAAASVRKLILSHQKNRDMTVLLTSHNMHEVEELCDRVALLQKGQLFRIDTPAAIIKYLKVSNMEEAFLKLAEEEAYEVV